MILLAVCVVLLTTLLALDFLRWRKRRASAFGRAPLYSHDACQAKIMDLETRLDLYRRANTELRVKLNDINKSATHFLDGDS